MSAHSALLALASLVAMAADAPKEDAAKKELEAASLNMWGAPEPPHRMATLSHRATM